MGIRCLVMFRPLFQSHHLLNKPCLKLGKVLISTKLAWPAMGQPWQVVGMSLGREKEREREVVKTGELVFIQTFGAKQLDSFRRSL